MIIWYNIEVQSIKNNIFVILNIKIQLLLITIIMIYIYYLYFIIIIQYNKYIKQIKIVYVK